MKQGKIIGYHTSGNPNLKIEEIDFNKSGGYPAAGGKGLYFSFDLNRAWSERPIVYRIEAEGLVFDYSQRNEDLELVLSELEDEVADVVDKICEREGIDIVIYSQHCGTLKNSKCIQKFERIR